VKDHNGESRLDEARKSDNFFFPKKCKTKGCYGMTRMSHGLCKHCVSKRNFKKRLVI
jgi:hypothetical protein